LPPLFSSDGRFLVLTTRPNGVRIWDAATGDPISPPLAHAGVVESASFSSDGRVLLTACDRAARVWSLSVDDRTADDWLRLAQLLSCSRMHAQGGRPVPLLPDELRAAWDELRRKSASAFVVAPRDAITWHAEAARACEKIGRWDAALPHLEHLAVHDPERLDLYARRGRAYAEAGQWSRAAADFEKAATLAADNRWLWYRHAVVRLHLDEHEGYRRVCADMLDRFGSSKDLDAAQLAAWTGSLAPAPQAEADRLVVAAERAVKDNPKNHARLLTLGAALYRARRYQDAVRTLDEAVKIWGKGDTTWDWLFLAMAHHHLGSTGPAKTNFDKAAKWIDQRQVKGADGIPTSTLFWSDRLELAQLRREAESLLNEAPRK
jgi:tetratricopeptide (TPR) repeat protein